MAHSLRTHSSHAGFRSRAALIAAVVLPWVAACGDKTPAPKRAEPVAVSPVATPRALSPGDSACPRDGLWKPCALVDRIVHAGLYFKVNGDTLRVPYLSVPGVRYQVGTKARMVVFYYADSAALRRDLAPLDTINVVQRGDTVGPWGGRPSAVRSGNLLAVLIDGSSTQIERVGLAITAGAPQRYSTDPK